MKDPKTNDIIPLNQSPTGRQETLFLTNNKSSQQKSTQDRVRESKADLYGKPFKTKLNPPSFCRRDRIAIVQKEHNKVVKIKYTKRNCNSWTCPHCQFKRALKVKYLLRDVIVLNKLSYFLTLTLDPSKIPPSYTKNTHEYITKLFNHFITVIKRKKFKYHHKIKNRYYTLNFKSQGDKLKYVWVIEFQKNGNAHLHILFSKYLPIDIIRKVWSHVGGGNMMRIEKVFSLEGVSHYVSDYIVKGIHNNSNEASQLKYFQKRYSISRSCIRPESKINKADPADETLREVYNTLNSDEYEEKEIIV